MSEIHEFVQSPAGAALIAMVGVAFADFLTGSFAALRDGTFTLSALDAYVRKHIWGRVAPVGTLLVLGYFGGDGLGQLFMAGALAAAATYVAATAASVVGNLNPPKDIDVRDNTAAAARNPIPEE